MTEVTYSKIDKDFKRRWLKALRSGKYKQTRGNLRGQRGFCCLGVACDISDPPHDMWQKNSFGDWEPTKANILINLGLCANTRSKLVSLNDSGHHNFKQIADWISKNL